MSLVNLSLHLLRRDWRAGEWRVLLLALLLAVGSLATVGLLADRVRQALQQQVQNLMGADLRITSTRPLAAEYRVLAESRGLRVVQSRTFPSMVAHGEQVLLSEIQAVGQGYPLRGGIVTEPPQPTDSGLAVAGGDGDATAFAHKRVEKKIDRREATIPEAGSVWADERLLRRLNLRVGDEVGIGTQHFKVAARIVKDVDQAISFASFAPRVLMNEADLPATGLLQEGSRITYRLLFAGDTAQVAAFKTVLQGKLTGNEKLEDVRDARPEIRTALERAEHFLGLAALTVAVLAGVAMALAARRFVQRHLDACAVMRCLGAQQSQLLGLFLYQFMVLGIFAVLLGGVLGYVTQAVLLESIATLREANLPQPSVLPVCKAAVSGMALLLGFTFLPLLQLRRVSPLRVLRGELGAPDMSAWLIYGLAGCVLAGLFLWQAGSWRLGGVVLLGLLVGLALFAGWIWLLLQGLARYAGLWQSHWRQALRNLARDGRNTAIQVVALGLGGMALLVLTVVRDDLLQAWQGKLPLDTPNRFVLGIQPNQTQSVADFFVREQLPVPEFLPMVRGRLVAINERAITADSFTDQRAQALVAREFNLSYRMQLPVWNSLVAGQWWQSGDANALSLEEGIAQTLNIHLGDRLSYDVAGSRVTATVTSLRKVQWDSMKVNFFVIMPPVLLQDAPRSYLASFYLPADQRAVGDAFSLGFPNLVFIDTGEVIAQVRNIMMQISQAISGVFVFTLLSGWVVLYAALLATQDARQQQTAILRTLGADSRYLRRLYLAEFACIGGLSGLFAAIGATLLGWVLARWVLEIPYQGNVMIGVIGITGGIAVVMLMGAWPMRKLLRLSPMAIFRGV